MIDLHPLFKEHLFLLTSARSYGASDEEIAVALDMCEESGWDACAALLSEYLGSDEWIRVPKVELKLDDSSNLQIPAGSYDARHVRISAKSSAAAGVVEFCGDVTLEAVGDHPVFELEYPYDD